MNVAAGPLSCEDSDPTDKADEDLVGDDGPGAVISMVGSKDLVSCEVAAEGVGPFFCSWSRNLETSCKVFESTSAMRPPSLSSLEMVSTERLGCTGMDEIPDEWLVDSWISAGLENLESCSTTSSRFCVGTRLECFNALSGDSLDGDDESLMAFEPRNLAQKDSVVSFVGITKTEQVLRRPKDAPLSPEEASDFIECVCLALAGKTTGSWDESLAERVVGALRTHSVGN